MRLTVGTRLHAVHRRRAVLRNIVGHYLLDGHTLVAAHHKLDVGERRHLVGIRQAVQQFIRQRPERRQVLVCKVVVALRQHTHVVVVAEVRLKLVGHHQHGVVLDEVVVERRLLHHPLHTNDRHNHHQRKGRQHQPAPAQQLPRKLREQLVNLFNLHTLYYIFSFFKNEQCSKTFTKKRRPALLRVFSVLVAGAFLCILNPIIIL